jgi:hypothetical protein
MSARTEQLARAERDRGPAEHCTRCGGQCACQTEFPGSYRCQICTFIAAHPEGLVQHQREHGGKEKGKMTKSSGERELQAFVEAECPFLFDGSDEADGILDSDVAAYELLIGAMRDGLEDATREVANQNRLDIRLDADRREAMLLLDAQDPTWSMARNFDELSAKAQTTVIRTAKQLANRLVLQRRNRGTAGGGRSTPMTDPYQSQRMERMEQMARYRGYDMNTHAGRRAALDDVYAEHPHLRPRLARPGVMPVARATMGASYRLRRGAPPTGEPIGPPGANPTATVRPFAPHSEQGSRKPTPPAAAGTDGTGGIGGRSF